MRDGRTEQTLGRHWTRQPNQEVTMPFMDVTGQTFGRLIALKRLSNYSKSVWLCRCECGRTKKVALRHLSAGKIKSCGCLQQELYANGRANFRHGHWKNSKPTPEHNTWVRMRQRCYNENHDNYRYYGGRGITVCERWQSSFENFFADMGPRPSPAHSIDRINNDGNYEPGNCRWATRSEQMKNTHRSKTYTKTR
jgi:hypothetical protein